ACALTADGLGGVYLAGSTSGPFAGPHAGGTDALVAHFRSDGVMLWAFQFGTPGFETAFALAGDGAGGVFVGGQTTRSLVIPHTPGNTDAFLAHYSTLGVRDWILQFGTPANDDIRALAPDGSGGVFAAGPTGGDLAAPNLGRNDAFVARFTRAGD